MKKRWSKKKNSTYPPEDGDSDDDFYHISKPFEKKGYKAMEFLEKA